MVILFIVIIACFFLPLIATIIDEIVARIRMNQ